MREDQLTELTELARRILVIVREVELERPMSVDSVAQHASSFGLDGDIIAHETKRPEHFPCSTCDGPLRPHDLRCSMCGMPTIAAGVDE
jgi:hypothetical protein